MKQTLDRYFKLWERQDADRLLELFADDATYAVKPFDEIYRGRDAIAGYVRANTVAKLRDPHPRLLTVGYGDNRVFAEWEMSYERVGEGQKLMRGILVLEFEGEKIKALREHFESKKI